MIDVSQISIIKDRQLNIVGIFKEQRGNCKYNTTYQLLKNGELLYDNRFYWRRWDTTNVAVNLF